MLIAIAAIPPILYPLWLLGRSHRRPNPQAPDPVEWPGLSVLVPAYREREVIADKVRDVCRNGYPGDLEVLVVTDDAETANAARRTTAKVLESELRLGKAEAVNRGVGAATQPIVVITDADTRLERGSLAALARWFSDAGVGAVAGEKRVEGTSEGLYWRFESLVGRWESGCGTTIGLAGELAAVRRSRFTQIPRDAVVDDLWIALDVVEGGHTVRYEPEAIATETPALGLGAEWERRTRTVAGLLDTLWRRRELLIPGRSPVALELWGHKLMRAVCGPLAHAVLIAQAIASLRKSRLAVAFVIGHLAAVTALMRESRGYSPTAPERLAARVLFLQATGLGGTFRYLRGDRPTAWPKAERSADAAQAFRD